MTKYGFDYFVKRLGKYDDLWLFDEAARGRPSPWMQILPAGPVFKDNSDAVAYKMRTGGELTAPDLITGEESTEHVPGLGGNRYKNRALRYLVYVMFKMDIEDASEGEGEVDDETIKREIAEQCAHVLGIPYENWSSKENKALFADPDKLYRAAIAKGIDLNKEYIMSSDFQKKVEDTNNILSFVKRNRLPTAASHIKSKKRGDIQGGMSQEDMDTIETSIRDVIGNINRQEYYKRKRKNPNLPQPEQSTTGETGASNQFVHDSYTVTDALETAIEDITEVQQFIDTKVNRLDSLNNKFTDPKQRKAKSLENLETAFSEAEDYYKRSYTPEQIRDLHFSNLNFIDQLVAHYSKQHDFGVDLEKFNKQMNGLASSNPSIAPTINTVLKTVERVREDEEGGETLWGDVAPPDENTSESVFPGYSKEITDNFLTTPELRKQFKKYNNYRINKMQSRADELDAEMELMKSDDYVPDEDIDAINKGASEFLNKRYEQKKVKKPTQKQKQEEAAFDPETYTPTDYDYPEEDEESSYIMGYMTEQINKDKFKTKGEFKDRGCRKLSYHEWITKYQ